MKIRELKKFLPESHYVIANYGEYLGIGSHYVHDLIRVNVKDMDIINKEFRPSSLLTLIYDTVLSLRESGELNRIMTGCDEIENPLPVFTIHNGVLVESFTDKYGYPNIDDNGILMYDNSHYPTAKEALEDGVKDMESRIRVCGQTLKQKKEDVEIFENRILHYQSKLTSLYNHLSNHKDE